MFVRLLTVAVAATAAMTATPIDIARSAPEFATPTTSTTTSTTTVAPVLITPTTTTTVPPVLATPTTTTTTTTTTTAEPPRVLVAPTTPTTTAPDPPVIATQTTAATTPPVIANPTTTTEPALEVVLGEIDTSGFVPDGLDLAAVPDLPESPPTPAGGPQFAAGFSCAYQCIESGVAYPRGFGALLVVELHVEADVFMSVLDADSNLVDHFNSEDLASRHEWALDHLEPGGTYFVTVAATDENDDTALAYGEFETLADRTITLWIGDPVIAGGPTNIIGTDVHLRVDELSWRLVDPPEELVYHSLPRHLDLAVFVERVWAHSQSTFCESWTPGDETTYGNDDASCSTWNTARLNDVDTDAIPAGRSHWTEVEISPPVGSGDGVPPEGAGPRYFDFSVVVSLTIEYH